MLQSTLNATAPTETLMRWVRLFREGSAQDRDLLGGKGANLAEMTRVGLPVPPGFTVTTEACNDYFSNGGAVPDRLWDEVGESLREVESQIGRRYGDPNALLLLSVRSGAKFSMPGMMETVLNLGLNDVTVQSLAREAGERFAWDAYRRLVQMFGKVVLDVDGDLFEEALGKARAEAGVAFDYELEPARLIELVKVYKAIIADHGMVFPDDPGEQLREAILAVFKSWNTPRAQAYRRSARIAENLGTAVNVQVMVFGNTGPESASGVAFTRNPSTGDRGLFGEYLPNAQGEDVVSGIRTPRHVEEMGSDPQFSDAYQELVRIGEQLEEHYRDMQDVEFTVERGKLWMLQTRTGKRTAPAAVKVAVDMAHEGLIDRQTAVLRVQPDQLEQLLHPRVDDSQPIQVIAEGLPASPGAAAGAVVFDPLEAKARGEQGESVILVRRETSADDFPGMERAKGILTAHGGMTSHAAVVARGIGKPAITGCGVISVDYDRNQFTVGDLVIKRGEVITLDGSTGRVILGEVAMVQPEMTGRITELLQWADDVRTLGVRANADLPEDARHAVEFGAEGIGLCRTEHMFFDHDRIDKMRAVILAPSDEARRTALELLEPMQTADFEAIFRVMHGLPVTIRLLDPPLHEFLPHTEQEQLRTAALLGISLDDVQQSVAAHEESNPMLGTRGVRVGLLYPDISRMQARAIITAALRTMTDGIDVKPEIMIPLVADPAEFVWQKALIEETAEEVFAREGLRCAFSIGSMIEVPRAALLAADIARDASFFSFGTNDLTQMTYGLSRDDSEGFVPIYVEQGIFEEDPFQVLDRRGVGKLIELAHNEGKLANPDLVTGICGEHGGEPASVAYCHSVGLDYVSCSPYRLPIARLAAAHAALGSTGAHDK